MKRRSLLSGTALFTLSGAQATAQPLPDSTTTQNMTDDQPFSPYNYLYKDTDLHDENEYFRRLIGPLIGPAIDRDDEALAHWTAVRDELSRHLDLTYSPTSKFSLAARFSCVEASLALANDDLGMMLPFLHVEVLLDQAADLLDRATRDRTQWEQTSRDHLDEVLNFLETANLEEQKELEIEAGSFRKEWVQNLSEFMSARYEYMAALQDERILADRLAVANPSERDTIVSALSFLQNQPSSSFQYSTVAGLGPKAQLSSDLTDKLMNIDLQRQRLDLRGQAASAGRKTQSVKRKLQKLRDSATIYAAESDGKYKRYKISRQFRDLRAYSLAHPNGILNRRRRLDELQARIELDVSEAVLRVKAVNTGISQLFDFQEKLPDLNSRPDLVGDLLLWVRKAIQRQIRFSRSDQTSVQPFALRALLGEAGWADFQKGEPVTFELQQGEFPDMKYIRLRGISISLIAADNASGEYWQLAIQPPSQGTYVRRNDVITLAQNYLKAVQASKVQSFSATRDPTIYGSVSLFNATPMGKWTIQKRQNVTPYGTGMRVDDLVLDIHVNFQA